MKSQCKVCNCLTLGFLFITIESLFRMACEEWKYHYECIVRQ